MSESLPTSAAPESGLVLPNLASFAPHRRGWFRSPLAAWLVVALLVAIVAIPMLVVAVPREIARWRLESARSHYLDRNLAGVQQALASAVQTDPNNATLLAKAAILLTEMDDGEGALAYIDRALELRPNNSRFLSLRAAARQKTGDHAAAIPDLQTVVELLKKHHASTESDLNGLAYTRALAGVDLAAAHADMDGLLALRPNLADFLDTRGYILFKQGQFPEAAKDLDAAVQRAENRYGPQIKLIETQSKRLIDDREALWQLERLKRTLAVIYYHRHLVRQAQGDLDAAAQDEAKVRELGFEPSDKLY